MKDSQNRTVDRSFNILLERPRTVLGFTALIAIVGFGLGAKQDGEVLEGTKDLIRQRMEVQRMIWEEKREWALTKETLESQIGLRQSEINRLKEDIAKAQADIGEADAKIAELVTEDDKSKAVEASLVEQITALEARAKELLPMLPIYLQDKVEPLSQQFPEKPEETKLSVSVRYANLAAVLGEVIKANAEISVNSERRELGDGNTAEVSALYLGLSKAFFVTAKGDFAGVGTPSPEGWVWTAANESALDIQLAIDVYGSKVPAQFVGLPVTID